MNILATLLSVLGSVLDHVVRYGVPVLWLLCFMIGIVVHGARPKSE